MHVLVEVSRQIVVDDMLDSGDVEAARGHRSGDEDGPIAIAEAIERRLAFVLRAVSVDADCRVGVAKKEALEIVGAALRLHEHQRERVWLYERRLSRNTI